MSVADLSTEDAPLRRIRSAGDMPRHPAEAHLQSFRGSRLSEGGHRNTWNPPIRTGSEVPHNTALSHIQSSTPELHPLLHAPSPTPISSQRHPQPSQQRNLTTNQGGPPSVQLPRGSWFVRLMAFFGLGRRASRSRKTFVSLLWNLSFEFAQITVISTMLGLIGTKYRSPTQPDISEWRACDRPLGVWCSLWIVKAFLTGILAYWEFVRERTLHPNHSEESGISETSTTPQAPPVQEPNATTAEPNPPHLNDPRLPASLPYNRLYSRLTLLSSLITLSWFLTAHILEYTSINTCRHSAPHLWWLTFGILCILYLMVLEVVLLGFIVLVVAPILFVFWNIFLICIGRHPLQNPHIIKPEIGKLPKSVVDRIPLVMYIPPPPENADEKLVAPDPAYLYPPKSPASPTLTPTRKRFRFLRSFSSLKDKKGNSTINTSKDTMEGVGPVDSWEGNWEKGDYPFVVLEGNRAACAICLMDFEEPKRKNAPEETNSNANEGKTTSSTDDPITNASIPEDAQISDSAREDHKLTDAGDGAQPLRLLLCGHVFHKTCLDPWLTDVSGRCPVCQRPVELPDPKKSKMGRRQNS